MPTNIAFRTARVTVAAAMGAMVLAWAGFYAAQRRGPAGTNRAQPRDVVPDSVTIGCLAVFLIPATHVAGCRLMLGWTMLNLLGGGLSVLPLPFLPFVPEQSFRHYAFHALYGLSQLPLLWLCICLVRHSSVVRPSEAGATSPPNCDKHPEQP